jgi:hypothetical protein
MKCGDCKFLLFIEGQQYHDCRYDAPNVVVSGFKPNPQNPEASFGKIMTVWPRVGSSEQGCGRFSPK